MNNFENYLKTRPLGVTILGGIHVLWGLWALCSGLAGSAIKTLTLCLAPISFSGSVYGIFQGIALLAVGSALLNGKPWGRMLAIVLSIANIILAVLSGLGGGSLISIVLSVIILVYMNTDEVKRFFKA